MFQNDPVSRELKMLRFPLQKLKRVDEPTTRITDQVRRFDEREQGRYRAGRGDFGPLAQKEHHRASKFPIYAAEQDMARHLVAVAEGEVAPNQAPLPSPELLSCHIKNLGHFLRADMVGICKLPQYAVYSVDKNGRNIELNHKYAVVVLVDQSYETMQGSTGNDWISNAQSFRSYSTTAFIACIMADYIRKLGYPARAHHWSNYQVALPPLLLLAGMGEVGRVGGCVVNPFLGLRFKAAAVTTDLPLVSDKPIDFGLQRFCRVCKRCAEECPAHAISTGDKEMYNGYECWKCDTDRCTLFRTMNQKGDGCGRCVKVCPWNKPMGGIHNLARWAARHAPWLDGFMVRMDSLLGADRAHPENKWWLDLELVNGQYHVPKPVKEASMAASLTGPGDEIVPPSTDGSGPDASADEDGISLPSGRHRRHEAG